VVSIKSALGNVMQNLCFLLAVGFAGRVVDHPTFMLGVGLVWI
jgi:hypothetical protein